MIAYTLRINRKSQLILLSFVTLFTLATLYSCQPRHTRSSTAIFEEGHRKPLQHKDSGKSLENLTAFRGHLIYGHEVRSITLCDNSKELWVIDQTEGAMKRISNEIGRPPYTPIFIEAYGRVSDVPADGFGTDYEGAIILTAITHASRIEDSWGCREKYDEFIFKGQGNEPGWTCLITKTGIKFSSINLEHPIIFPAPHPSHHGDATVFKSETENHALKVFINETLCRGTMADEIFGWQMELTLDGTTYRGCAKRGDIKQ